MAKENVSDNLTTYFHLFRNFNRNTYLLCVLFLLPLIFYVLANIANFSLDFQEADLEFAKRIIPIIDTNYQNEIMKISPSSAARMFLISISLILVFVAQCLCMIWLAIIDVRSGFANLNPLKNLTELIVVYAGVLGITYWFIFISHNTMDKGDTAVARAMDHTDLKFLILASLLAFCSTTPYLFFRLVRQLTKFPH